MSGMVRLGSFEELLEGKDAEIQVVAVALKNLILSIHSDAIEVVRLGDKAASFGVGPKKMSEAYAYIMPLKKYVNLGFYHGSGLADPNGLLEGTGKRLRHVKIRSVKSVSESALKKLIEVALAERITTLSL